MKMKSVFYLPITLFIFSSSFSQNLNNALVNFAPASPSASALGKFGDIPVGYATGIPEIKIPIYNYRDNSNGLGLDISLDYHAGGIRVTEKASNVGIGWALNAGGVINREMRGGPDDGEPGEQGYWSAPALPNVQDYINNPNLYGTSVTPTNPYYSIYAGLVDAEPDVFSFNFNGHSGKFVIGKNGQAYIWPQQQLTITKAGTLGTISFTIVDEEGKTYVFDQQEISQMLKNGVMVNVGSSWYLSKIISPFSISEIDFNYQSVPELYIQKLPQVWYKSLNGPLTSSSETYLSDQAYASYTLKQLTQISFPDNTKVNFFYDAQARCDVQAESALSKIEITDGVNTKGFRLDHDYQFGLYSAPVTSCTNIDPNSSRLVLHQVTEYNGSVQNPPYIIEYNNTYALPSVLSYAQDHWGFFNGAYNNGSLFPYNGLVGFVNYTSTTGIDNADRRTNPAYAISGTISKLTYPTGGSTRFTFESNDIPDNGSTTYISQPALAVINGTDPSKSTYFTLATNSSTTTFQFNFGGFSSDDQGCSITASIMSTDESKTYTSVILGPGIGYTQSMTVSIPPGQYKYKYVFGTACIAELFVVNLQWNNLVPAPQGLKDYIGGLRIKKIEDLTGANNPSVRTREYSYLMQDKLTSSGGISIYPAYSYNYSESCVDGNICATDPQCAQRNTTYLVLNSSSLFSLSNTLGSPVLYSRVEEKFTGDGTGNNGKIVRYFNATGTTGLLLPTIATNPQFFTFPYVTPEVPVWIYGLLSADSTYDNNNNLKHSTLNEYSCLAFVPDNLSQAGLKGIKVFGNTTNYAGTCIASILFSLDDYYPFTGRSELVNSAKTSYGDNGVAETTTTTYNYDPVYYSVTKITTSDSKGIVHEQRLYYPFNVTSGIPSEMVSDHIFSPVVSKETWETYPDPTLNQMIGGEITEFAKYNNNNFIKPSVLDFLNTAAPVNISVIGNFNPNALVRNTNYFKQEVQLGNYDAKGNVTQQTKTNDVPESYMWGYNQSRLVAKVRNASNTLVQYYGPTTSFGTLSVPQATNGTASATLTTYFTGGINLSISFNGPPSANSTGRVSYSLSGPATYSGALCVTSGSSTLCSGYGSSISIPNAPVGTYTLAITTNINSDVATGSTVMISYNYTGQQLLSSGIREFFYEGFEENASATTANKYAGDKSYAGSYQVPFTMPNSRSYIVEYHYYNGSQWVYVKKPYTNNMILSDGPYIDEVRVYPSDALMTTYTYEPLYGLSSETDMSGKTIFYEYDGFQRLKNVKDYQGNIIKSYQYNYAH